LRALRHGALEIVLVGLDARQSAKFYKSFWSVIGDDSLKAAGELMKLFRSHRMTFLYSGWTRIAIGRIVIGSTWSGAEEKAAKWFVGEYWKELRRKPAEKSLRAYEALDHVRGEHREHWLEIAAKVKGLGRNRRNERPSAFAIRAVSQLGGIHKCCMSKKAVAQLAIHLTRNPHLRSNALADVALAQYFKTSRSTLQHTRAALNRR
jgi:hypothetical protein